MSTCMLLDGVLSYGSRFSKMKTLKTQILCMDLVYHYQLQDLLKMTRSTRVHRRFTSRKYRSAPYSLPSCNCEVFDKDVHLKKCSKALEKEDWENATCAVCLEHPHNAVLLLCSSHDKGCRPYMCATSYRYSNCLDQYEKAYKKVYLGVGLGSDWPEQKHEVMELACPLCRGQVKGWTVVEAARKYLDAKKRTCMQDNCSFAGTYKGLRKHVKLEHPSAGPREVDPILEQKWKSLVHEREQNDLLSTITSSMPGSVVVGDYVIDRNHRNFDTDDDEDEVDDRDFDDHSFMNMFILLQAIQGRSGIRNTSLTHERGYFPSLNGEGGVHRGMSPSEAISVGEGDSGPSLRRRRIERVVNSGRSVRRRRHGE